VLDFEDERLIGWERIATPATPMLLFEAQWFGGEGRGLEITSKQFPSAQRVKGAECRVRYRVPSDEREAAGVAADRLRAQMLECGAIAVKVEEEVMAVGRARAPEIGAATTVAEKLEAMWRLRGVVPEGPRRAKLLERVGELETANE